MNFCVLPFGKRTEAVICSTFLRHPMYTRNWTRLLGSRSDRDTNLKKKRRAIAKLKDDARQLLLLISQMFAKRDAPGDGRYKREEERRVVAK